MKDIKPYAWVMKRDDYHSITRNEKTAMLQKARTDQDWTVTPLYAMPEGNVIVPVEPTEDQWGGLARHLMMWLDLTDRPTGERLYNHLGMLGIDPPEWLTEEIPDTNAVPSKGTRVAVIYKAMLKAAQEEG